MRCPRRRSSSRNATARRGRAPWSAARARDEPGADAVDQRRARADRSARNRARGTTPSMKRRSRSRASRLRAPSTSRRRRPRARTARGRTRWKSRRCSTRPRRGGTTPRARLRGVSSCTPADNVGGYGYRAPRRRPRPSRLRPSAVLAERRVPRGCVAAATTAATPTVVRPRTGRFGRAPRSRRLGRIRTSTTTRCSAGRVQRSVGRGLHGRAVLPVATARPRRSMSHVSSGAPCLRSARPPPTLSHPSSASRRLPRQVLRFARRARRVVGHVRRGAGQLFVRDRDRDVVARGALRKAHRDHLAGRQEHAAAEAGVVQERLRVLLRRLRLHVGPSDVPDAGTPWPFTISAPPAPARGPLRSQLRSR